MLKYIGETGLHKCSLATRLYYVLFDLITTSVLFENNNNNNNKDLYFTRVTQSNTRFDFRCTAKIKSCIMILIN